jgi:hypothetical protein
MQMKRDDFKRLIDQVGDISRQELVSAEKQMRDDNAKVPSNPKVAKFLRLVDQLGVSTHASKQSLNQSRAELVGMVLTFGLPSWYMTLNVSDLRCPFVYHFANGHRIEGELLDADDLVLAKRLKRLAYADPVAAVKAFDLVFRFVTFILSSLSLSHFVCIRMQGDS